MSTCWAAFQKDTNGVLIVYNPDQANQDKELVRDLVRKKKHSQHGKKLCPIAEANGFFLFGRFCSFLALGTQRKEYSSFIYPRQCLEHKVL